ncbi:hypothetical protein ACHAPV_004718 [Trichoderma viride]|jgi:hypothetical protein
MSYSEALTLPNLRDKLRQEVLQRVDQILEDLRVELRPLTKERQIGGQSTVKNALHNKKKELAAVQQLIRILHEEYLAGHLDTADEELCMDRYNLDRRCRALSDDTTGQEIGDRIHDDITSERSNGSINTFTHAAYNSFPRAPDASDEGQGFEVADDETMDVFLPDDSNGPGARPMSPLSSESNDSMDAIEIEIDGKIEIGGEDSEAWEDVDVDDEYEWGDKWVNVDEDGDEYADEDGHKDVDVY